MPPKPLGADYVNNCLISAGFTWCELLNKCLRLWETPCEYPTNCLTWYDGCNTCSLVEGEDGMTLGGCTEMMCFQQEMPYCMVQTPEMIIDPMPPIRNPFLTPISDGH
jgi:hypothetical protein